MKNRRMALLIFAGILILACSCPMVGSTAVIPTQTSAPTAAPAAAEATNTTAASAPPTVVVAASPSTPMASPNGQPVNCRSGPGLDWDVSVVLQVGQSTEIVGKTADGTWFQVRNLSLPGSFCWVSASVVSTTGNVGGVQIVAAPPTLPVPPTSVAVVVTDVSVSVTPSTIGVAGCMGPIQPSTAVATITVNGAIKLQWHFETQQNGSLPIHSVNFIKASSKDVSATFTPPLTPGTYTVELFIEGMNLNGMNTVAKYKIHC